ncbi:MAG TPA: tetraacyldisaccharide 4'-kinase [Chitinophagaceae bacterium]
MNFNTIFLRSFRVLLLPFALLYGFIIIIRNFLYDKNLLRSAEFNFPLICVGNLIVGGTGKSPMVEYLIELLYPYFKVATLSRGYKRNTKGYVLATETTTALEIGDEPMQFHIKFPGIAVAAGEERIVAIPQLLHDKPDTQVIILDDAFQHRVVKAGFNILLTQYEYLYTKDFFLPTGDLRDQRSSAKRAHIIIVTKCPADLNDDEKNKIIEELHPKDHQQIFFTTTEYGLPYHVVSHAQRAISQNDEILLVSGIANPDPLKQFLSEHVSAYYQLQYNDHHIFTITDLKDIQKKFSSVVSDKKIIITTEKDAVRLLKFSDQLSQLPLYVLPVKHKFLFGEGEQFNKKVIDFIQHFYMSEVEVNDDQNPG